MRSLHAIALFFLFFELPIPLYWLILHPFHSFWRTRVRAAFWTAGLTAWGVGGVALWYSWRSLLAQTRPSWFAVIPGLLLIAAEIYLLIRVERELGSRRLVGHAELTDKRDFFAGGLYAYVRHPRYAGMFCAVAGAGLIAGTKMLWSILAAWSIVALLVIYLEERELTARFGASYREYQRRVPAFVPIGPTGRRAHK